MRLTESIAQRKSQAADSVMSAFREERRHGSDPVSLERERSPLAVKEASTPDASSAAQQGVAADEPQQVSIVPW
jgi:hypothetical protein